MRRQLVFSRTFSLARFLRFWLSRKNETKSRMPMRQASHVRQRECFSAEIRIDYGRYRKRMTHSFKIPLMKSTLIYHNLMPNVFCVLFHNLLGLGWQILRHIMMMSSIYGRRNFFLSFYKKTFLFFSCIGGELFKVFPVNMNPARKCKSHCRVVVRCIRF